MANSVTILPVLLFLVGFIFTGIGGLPLLDDSSNFDYDLAGPSGDTFSWVSLVVLSIGSVITLVTILFACGAGGCCGIPKIYWFGRSRQQTPMSFDNPVADMGLQSGSSIPLSQIDVRTLELDPVVFEPLPTIQDLSPLSLNQSNNSQEGRHRGRYLPTSPQLQFQNPSTIIPFASEDSELYAHDWFDEPHRNFQRNNIEFIREVGKGWFGEVLEADAKDIVPFAKIIKVLVKRLKQDASQLDQMRFLDESRIYRDANQGNILKLLGHSIEKLPFLLIMEQCPQGDLKSYLISNVTRAETLSTQGVLLKMALDIAKGLEWMIDKGFKHSDLAARNCQVASEGRIVIGDYGLGIQMFKDDYYWNSNVPIPLRWAAPETIHCTPTTIQTLKVTAASNIWTYSVVLWEVTEFAKLPFFELSDEEVITRVLAEKNYVLEKPTLPYIPFKDELYHIMKSCWSIDPAMRPAISTIVVQLQQLVDNPQSHRKDDEFETKWERLGRISSSSSGEFDNRPRGAKKSVSFTGIQNMQIDDQALVSNSMERLRDMKADEIDVSNEKLKDNQEQEDDNENEKWIKEIEDGAIADKVMKQTNSVQDFMVLTHVELSDIHGPESLIEVAPNNSFDQNNEVSTESSVDPWPTTTYSQHDSGTSMSDLAESSSSMDNRVLAKASFESGKSDSISSCQTDSSRVEDSQHQSNIGNNNSNSLSIPEISVQQSTPGTTPNLTGIDISVTEASPNPYDKLECDDDDSVSNDISNFILQATTSASRRRIAFKFDFDCDSNDSLLSKSSIANPPAPRRHTSTPKRSASSSPILPMDESNGCVEDVFENETSDNENMTFNETVNLSPISIKRAKNGVRSGELVTTIVGFGGNDDLGLGMFQGVTSQLDDNNIYFDSANPPESEYFSDFTPTIPKAQATNGKSIPNGNHNFSNDINAQKTRFGKDMPILAGDIRKGEPVSLTPRPDSSESRNNVTASSDQGTLLEGESQSSSWDVISNNGGVPSNGSSSWDNVSTREIDNPPTDPLKINIVPLGPVKESTGMEVDNDLNQFWNRQMKSLSTAAEDTKSLLALSLRSAGKVSTNIISPSTSPADKFVEDINSANQELGSLVMEDLEDESIALVPESHHEQDNRDVKLAFVTGPESSKVDGAVNSISYTTVEPWDNNGETGKVDSKSQSDQENSPSYVSDDKNDEASSEPTSLSGQEFVPSTWQKSLAPARPSIKSPNTSEISQHDQKSSLKKSVSFERQKKQIVYEYPPPPPVSDSEDDLYALRTSSKVATIPLHSSLDWDLTQEELEFAQVNPEDSDEDIATTKSDPMDMYRISGFDFEDSFKVRPSTEPFSFLQPESTLGQLRHTKDKLKLDLSRGEASLLDEDLGKTEKKSRNPQVLDSGVGSSTNVSPFIHSSGAIALDDDHKHLQSNRSLP